jgi:putative SOS response-associated peptidase YedK
MCGRYTLNTTGRDIASHFKLEVAPDVEPRYNVAPTQTLPVVRKPDEQTPREAAEMRWGLIPFWADDPSIGNRMINARSETVHEKNAYRVAFSRRRCLVPASGFFEWQKTGDGKQPWYFHHADDELLGFAGIWEHWEDDETGEVIESYSILTGEPNDTVSQVHKRMPVTLLPGEYDFWLNPEVEDKKALHDLATTVFPSEMLTGYPVSTRVNSPKNDDASILDRLESAG